MVRLSLNTDKDQEAPLKGVVDRLASPEHTVTLQQLPELWFQQTISINMSGYGALHGMPELLNNVRRSWGAVLGRSASLEALASKPCPWDMNCTFDIFFREQLRFGKDGLPKPFVLSSSRKGSDLLIHLRIFGFSTEWLMSVRDTLIQALCHEVPFKKFARGLFLPAPEVRRVRIETLSSRPLPPVPEYAVISFQTPFNTSGDHIFDNPGTLIGRLARRLDAMARWQDVLIDEDWGVLANHWHHELEYDLSGLARDEIHFWSGRSNSNCASPAVTGELIITGEIEPVWPILYLGRWIHAGKGAVQGYGRYELTL